MIPHPVRTLSSALALLVGLLHHLVFPHLVLADEAVDDNAFVVTATPLFMQLEHLEKNPPINDPAPIWEYLDTELQARVEQALERLDLMGAVKKKKLGVVLLDITNIKKPRMASINGDKMMYAASLPKIAILLAAFEKIAAGQMELNHETEELMKAMIQRSSNSASTELMHRVGKENIAKVLLSPKYRLYDPLRGGGLWVGKDYAKAGLWRRDPLNNLSHGATPIEVARFYYMLETGKLVSPFYSRKMKEILGQTYIRHKFAKALLEIDPFAHILRKSGSWRTFHADSAVIRHGGHAYIAVGLSNDPEGGEWLAKIAKEFDAIILEDRS
jgi:beta-lactamase class A